jgi:hypothetical protein
MSDERDVELCGPKCPRRSGGDCDLCSARAKKRRDDARRAAGLPTLAHHPFAALLKKGKMGAPAEPAVKRNLDTPEAREFWASAEASAAEVESWPASKRAGINTAQVRGDARAPAEPATPPEICTHPSISLDGKCTSCGYQGWAAVPIEFARRLAEIERASAPAGPAKPTKVGDGPADVGEPGPATFERLVQSVGPLPMTGLASSAPAAPVEGLPRSPNEHIGLEAVASAVNPWPCESPGTAPAASPVAEPPPGHAHLDYDGAIELIRRGCSACMMANHPYWHEAGTPCPLAATAAPAAPVREPGELTFAAAMALDPSQVEVKHRGHDSVSAGWLPLDKYTHLTLSTLRQADFRRKPAPKPGRAVEIADAWSAEGLPSGPAETRDLCRDVAREALACVRRLLREEFENGPRQYVQRYGTINSYESFHLVEWLLQRIERLERSRPGGEQG